MSSMMRSQNWFRFLAIALASLATAPRANALTILSDVDDTIKISHVGSTTDVLVQAMRKQDFAGMAEVFQGLASDVDANTFYYVSASPAFLFAHLQSFLSENGFPNGKLLLRGLHEAHDVGAYKVQKISSLLEQSRFTGKVILLGDDTQKDPDSYRRLSELYPGRVDSIFIHQVTGKAFSAQEAALGVHDFFTALDLAVSLYDLKKTSATTVAKVARKILDEPDFERIVAHYQVCPKSGYRALLIRDPSVQPILTEAHDRIAENLAKICASGVQHLSASLP